MVAPEVESPRRAATQVPLAVMAAVALALVLRLVQLSSSVVSPLTYQLGPDEDYYFRFAQAVIAGRADGGEFLFMDPLYGYLLAAVFRMVGPSLFVVFAVQCVLDTATAIALLLIGRELGRPRAGVMAALLYALVSSALMFACSLLKEVWVAAFFTWWVFLALRLTRSDQRWPWLAFGLYCGIGVGLRSTALLLLPAAALLPLLQGARTGAWATRSALLAVGMVLAVLPWSVRNAHADAGWSPLPHNSGIVLHQVYNEDNPASSIWIPPFVNYLNPSEIWRGYAAEAVRRAGHPMSAPQIDAYWKGRALGYIGSHPLAVAATVSNKALRFFASADTPINRSPEEEALFSPLMRWLPAAAPWLIALGLPGILCLARTDRRGLIIAVPVAVAFLTVMLFWAEDRFRFHAYPMLALGAGLLVDYVMHAAQSGARRAAAVLSAFAALLLVTSLALGRSVPPTPLHWDQIVWGYIKMNHPREAEVTAARVVREQPENGAVWEAMGYLAVMQRHYAEAEPAYRRALASRPHSDLAHYDLAKVLEHLGRRPEALAEAQIALELKDDPDYRALVTALKNSPTPET